MSSNFVITSGSLPTTFRGTWQDFADQLPSTLTISLNGGKSVFCVGNTQPEGDQGPWLKDGTRWYSFDSNQGKYVPVKTNALFKKVMIQGTDPVDGISGVDEEDSEDEIVDGDFWIKTTDGGTIDTLNVYYDEAWHRLSYSLVDRADFLKIIDNLPAYINSKIEPLLTGINSSISSLQAQLSSISVVAGEAGEQGPKGPTGDKGASSGNPDIDLLGYQQQVFNAEQYVVSVENDVATLSELEVSPDQEASLELLWASYNEAIALGQAIYDKKEVQEDEYNELIASIAERQVGLDEASIEALAKTVLEANCPVGTIVQTRTSSAPYAWSGTTWNRIATGRILFGAGSIVGPGGVGGEAEVRLTASQCGVPAHSHDIEIGNGFVKAGTDVGGTNSGTTYTTTTDAFSKEVADFSHNNMPPYTVVYFWRREG